MIIEQRPWVIGLLLERRTLAVVDVEHESESVPLNL